MQLLADRFVLVDDEEALDLATGERVALTLAPAGGESEQRQWALACDAAARCHHPAIARLVDYGIVGGSQRFEARRIDPDGAGSGPDGETPSLMIIPRPVVATIGEVFERPLGVRPRSVTLWGPHGSGKHTIVGDLARIARLQGFVPVTARVLATFADALRGRSLFVIDDGRERAGWTAWLVASLGASRPHVLLFVTEDEPPLADAIGVEPVAVHALVSAVRPTATTAARVSAIERFAQQSNGWPGRFARLLWGQALPSRSRRLSLDDRRGATTSLRAAEQPAVYGVSDPPAASGTSRAGARPLPDEVGVWRGRIDSGTRLVAAGRHASGERLLRQAIGALARRGEWAHAGEGSMALAALLIRRGRAADAETQLAAATDFWRQAGDETRLIDVAVLVGTASIELARLDQAETAASAAATAAHFLGDEAAAGHALAVSARTLFWRATG